MIRVLILLLAFVAFGFGAAIEEAKWGKGETLLSFLEKNRLPLKLYYELDREDKELVEEIVAGVEYQTLKNEESGELEQVLIPVGEEVQIHISKNGEEYGFEIVPILYETFSEKAIVEIKSNPYTDIKEGTQNPYLAMEFVSAFKNSINFRRSIQKGDRLVIIYEQKMRLGKFFGVPLIKAAMVETGKKENYVFWFEDDETYYDQFGKEMGSFLLTTPVLNARVSSTFSTNRFHPVLKRYRPHFGVDYAAPVGTQVKASGNGRVSFVGEKGGYGKTVIIEHGDGYRTLYGHLNGYAKGARSGKSVKQGEVIGYIGSTGISTGPHLHFGMYKNNTPINPQKSLKIIKNIISDQKKHKFLALSSKYKSQIQDVLAGGTDKREKKRDYLVLKTTQN